ncbi:MAG TPA: hypothetical protein VF174_09930 [Micromonosporaceae bacterium]
MPELGQRKSGLLVPGSIALLRFRARTRTVTLPTGERAKVTVDDSGTVTHIETADRIGAIVRPGPVRMVVRYRQ